MNGEDKIHIMRILMKERGYSAYIIPHGDNHNNEYIADADERIKFISNFSGSNATGLVTQDDALMWTDSRYFIQIEKQLYKNWHVAKDISLEDYILTKLPPGSVIGLDFSLFTNDRMVGILQKLKEYVFMDDVHNIIDDVWGTLKPKYNENKIIVLPKEFAGETPLEKYQILNKKLREEILREYEEEENEKELESICYRLLISKMDSIAWLLNLRGSDIPYNPLFFSHAIFYSTPKECYVKLFADIKKFDSPEIQKYLKDNKISLYNYKDILKVLTEQEKYEEENFYTVIDRSHTSFRLVHELSQVNKSIDLNLRMIDKDCIEFIKYVKNPVEIQGFKKANIRDSLAVIKLLAWIENELLVKKRKDLTEVEIGNQSLKFRKENELFMGESFHSICGCGSNAAIVHYEQDEENNAIMTEEKIILLDTGGQYMDGTTDITRTAHFGKPTEKEKEMFTRVLLGNLSLERLIFKKGFSLIQLDIVPRAYLNIVGENYGHGTSHGVGHFLNVHEGPRRQMLVEGNIITNEPGFYLKDQFGIRTENEVLVVKKGDKLGFENLTYIPYDKNLIDMHLISDDFKEYIDNYHKKVFEIISPLIKEDDKITMDYLKRKTQPL